MLGEVLPVVGRKAALPGLGFGLPDRRSFSSQEVFFDLGEGPEPLVYWDNSSPNERFLHLSPCYEPYGSYTLLPSSTANGCLIRASVEPGLILRRFGRLLQVSQACRPDQGFGHVWHFDSKKGCLELAEAGQNFCVAEGERLGVFPGVCGDEAGAIIIAADSAILHRYEGFLDRCIPSEFLEKAQ